MKELKAEFEKSVERELENSLVRELAENIALDSKKHASFYQALIQHIENPLVPVTEKEYKELEEAIRRHIEIESEMISFIEGVRRKVVDKRVDFILKSILVDEHRHHELLVNLLELVVRKELVTEEGWENLTWNIMLDGV